MRKPFLTGYKTQHPGFQNFKFQFFCLHYIISTQTTYFNKKLRTLRRFTKPESDFRFVQFFFIHPVYCINSTDVLIRELNHANSDMLHLLTLQGEPFLKQAVGMVQAVGCNARYIIWYRL